MNCFLIVGKSFSGLTKKILQRGDKYIVLKDVPKYYKPQKKTPNYVYVNFSNEAELEIAIEKLGQIDGVITIYENYIITAAKIAKKLKKPGLSMASATACSDKYKMRGLLSKSKSNLCPDFARATNIKNVEKFAAEHHFPLILKPANLSKSLLVTKNDSLSQLQKNYKQSLNLIGSVYSKYAPASTPSLIIEEFLDGTIHSVDAFINDNGQPIILKQIVDYQTGHDVGYNDNFHYSRKLPSKLPQEKQKQLIECAKAGIKALGMRNSAAHVEIIMTASGPKIVEIGARNGGYRDKMHLLANGIDITTAALDIAIGKTPEIKATRNDPCTVLELFPKESGEYIGLQNEKKLRSLDSLVYLNIKAEKGQKVGKSSDGHKMCAVIVLHNSDKKQFAEDLAFVDNNVSVITK